MSPNVAGFGEHAFVRELIPAHIQLLGQCVRERTISKGDYLKRQGDLADEIYLIRSGKVALEISLPDNGTLRIEVIRAGSVVGWSCFVEPYRWRFDARALSEVTVFSIGADCLRANCDRDHKFGYAVLRRCAPVIAERLQATQIKLLELGT